MKFTGEGKLLRMFVGEADKLFDKGGCGGMVKIEKVDVIKYTPGK